MTSRLRACIGAAALLTLLSDAAAAQESSRDILSFLLTNQAVLTGDFVKDAQAAESTRDTMTQLLLVELATLPISSSAGGFVYRFNRSLASMERVSDSFGPFYMERALASGRGQSSFGITYRYARFDTLDGKDLRDGTIVTTANRLGDDPAPFDVEQLSLQLDATTVTVFGSYGVSDRLDVGFAVPVVTLNLAGQRVNRYRGDVFLQASASSYVTGLTDVAVRTKYNFLQRNANGLAAHVDVRLPTGSEENLLGAGKAALLPSLIASVERGPVAVHLKGGFGVGGVSSEINYGGAAVLAATPRLSLVGEFFGRRLDALARIGVAAAPHPLNPRVETTRLVADGTGTQTAAALLGVKWNFSERWLLNANVQLPLTNRGLIARPTPSIAVDRTFGH